MEEFIEEWGLVVGICMLCLVFLFPLLGIPIFIILAMKISRRGK